MIIGLTSEELMETFFECSKRRLDEFKSEVEAISHGESPEATEKWSRAIERSSLFPPGLTLELRTILTSTIVAIMDTIEINNTAIAKSIS